MFHLSHALMDPAIYYLVTCFFYMPGLKKINKNKLIPIRALRMLGIHQPNSLFISKLSLLACLNQNHEHPKSKS